MAFDTSAAVTAAADSANPARQAAIRGLNPGPINEERIKPVVDDLISDWIAAGEPLAQNHPTLKPILILESVRLAEALDQLAPITQSGGTSLPQLNQSILMAGTMKIDSIGLERIDEAARLLTALCVDCKGPLGAVYGVRRPLAVNAPPQQPAASSTSP